MSVIRGVAFICKSIIIRLAFTIFRILHNGGQYFVWNITGTQRQLSKVKQPEYYSQSAQVGLHTNYISTI